MNARVGGGRLLLSAAQLGIWLGQQLDPQSPAYWTAEYVELHGALDLTAFERAVEQATSEAQALHMRYCASLSEVWQELAQASSFVLTRGDFSDADEPMVAALSWMQRDLTQPARLSEGPLFATALLRLGPDHHAWYLRAHHIALDGYAYLLLQRRVAHLYAAFESGVSAAWEGSGVGPVVAEDQRYRISPAFARDRAFWRARLSGAPASPSLAPAEPIARSVRRHRAHLPHEVSRELAADAKRASVDGSAWLIAKVLAWLERETGVSQHTLGVPVAGRLGSVAAAVPCMMMNIVPLHLRWSTGLPLPSLAQAVQSELRAVRPHQRYRYEDLKQDLELAAEGRRLFGTVVNLMPFDHPLSFGSLRASARPLSAGPVEDLAVVLAPHAAGCRVDLEANPNAYSSGALERLSASLLEIFGDDSARFRPGARGAANPSWLVGGALQAPAPDVLAALQRAAAQAPDAIALEQDGRAALSYAALLTSVRRLAARLQTAGVVEESQVALLLPRTPEAIIAQLAVLWAGGAYVPLDPSGPRERLSLVLEDAQPRLVVTSRAHQASAAGFRCLLVDAPETEAAREQELSLPIAVGAHALAYVIYTSGSTGRPNGVMIERGALSHFVAAAGERYTIGPSDRVLQFATLQFDASVEEILVSLANGATLVLRTDSMLESLRAFSRACRALRLTVLDLPTSFWHEWAASLEGPSELAPELRLVIIGGEAALFERVERWRSVARPEVVLLNTYGPTETTVVCSAAALAGPGASPLADALLPIGEPLAGVDIAVVDAERRPVPFGEAGELCVLGPTLARGYQNREQANAERFVVLSMLEPPRRGYLTGDRVRVGPGAELFYLGRLDDELKISGHRVSPLEVEAALLTVAGVAEAAVVAYPAGAGGKRLCAFAVASDDSLTTAAVRSALENRLNGPQIPSKIVLADRLPRDSNGKLDRKTLATRAALPASAAAVSATPLEHLVLRVWSEVLGAAVTSPDLDFFALGGHSLLALQASQRLSRVLQREVPLSALFRFPTASALAESLRQPHHDAAEFLGQDPLAPLVALQGGTGLPLICIHPADGLSWCYLGLTRHLNDVPLYAVQAPGLTGAAPASFAAQIQDYLELIRTAQPRGPYRLLGWSSGGGIAHALACELRSRGEAVTLLAMLDAYPADIWAGTPEPTEHDALVSLLDDVEPLTPGQPDSDDELFQRLQRPGGSLASFDEDTLRRMVQVALGSMQTYRQAEHASFDGDVLFFRAMRRAADAPAPSRWQPYVGGQLELVDIDAHHLGMCQASALEAICRVLAPRCAGVAGALKPRGAT